MRRGPDFTPFPSGFYRLEFEIRENPVQMTMEMRVQDRQSKTSVCLEIENPLTWGVNHVDTEREIHHLFTKMAKAMEILPSPGSYFSRNAADFHNL